MQPRHAAPLLAFFLILLVVPIASANVVLKIDGTINQGVQDYILRGINYADARGDAIVIEIDTNGGSAKAMNEIIEHMESADVPIITYVSPRGAHAYSAGTFILMASDGIAMAPGTSIGACEPVVLAMGKIEPAGKKAKRAFAAKMRALAEKHDRNATIAGSFVTNDKSLTAEEALSTGMIDAIASDKAELVEKIDFLERGETIEIHENVREKFLGVITNPEAASLMFTLGLLLLVFGFISPGLYPESIGAILTALSIYGMGVIGVNVAGAALIVLGIIFAVLEIKTHTFGFFTAAAIISFILGGFILLPAPTQPGYQFSSPGWLNEYRLIIIAVVATIGSILIYMLTMIVRTQKKKMEAGKEAVKGVTGIAISDLNPTGSVKAMGEIWRAESLDGEIRKDEKVVIESSSGLKLYVKKIR